MTDNQLDRHKRAVAGLGGDPESCERYSVGCTRFTDMHYNVWEWPLPGGFAYQQREAHTGLLGPKHRGDGE